VILLLPPHGLIDAGLLQPSASNRKPSSALAPSPPSPPAEVPADSTSIIDMDVFQQIRDMDDDDEDEGGESSREFSRSIVWGYFEQAEATFEQMEEEM
jgi:osomolarity two-component system phosphorelay intermediate protein YPD1